jgi:glycosyltransferase involved in cell wall biosynthesis
LARMARIIVAANSSWNIENFRRGLVRALIRGGHEVVTLTPDRHALYIDGKAIRHRTCRMHRSSMNPLRDMFYASGLFRIIIGERPDVFLSFTIKPNVYGCSVCRLLRIPAFPNVSGLGTTFLSTSLLRRTALGLYRFAFRRVETVFFQNQDDEALFRHEKVVRADQSHILPGSGVDLTHFSATPLPTELRFLMIARLLGDKGVREYVGAARKVKSKFPYARFTLLGELDPDNRSSISGAELDVWLREGLIEYLGSASDVRPFIRDATAVVLPSYREGLSRTLLEGAAMGRPLIGTDVAGCREVVREGVTGFLCKPRDENSLAAAMEKFAALPYADRVRMGTQARGVAEVEFDEAIVARTYLNMIRRITA